MKFLDLKEDLCVSQVALGCWRIGDTTIEDTEKLVEEAIKEGINFIDLADIYANGKSEQYLGEVLKKHPDWRKKMFIQTKCGIRNNNNKYYDFSKEHIINSVEESLKRLNTNYIDVLLLHRPDTLMDPKEVADAFDTLYQSGKVKYFGVSNMIPMQMELLQKYMKQPLLFNQLQFNPVKANLVSNAIFTNIIEDVAIDYDRSTLDYCRLHDITIQPWSILQIDRKEGTFLEHKDYVELNEVLQKYADKYHVSKSAIVLAWILRHPANMQPILGTTKPSRVKEMCAGVNVTLTREEWYDIYMKGVQKRLP